jgi:hypothetical protein
MTAPAGLFSTPSRLLAHSRFVLQDFFLLRAPLPLFGGAIIVWNFAQAASAYRGAKTDVRFIAGAHATYAVTLGVLMFITLILAVAAIMTIDRTTGYFRFFFSKPVNVVRYYLHTTVLHGAAGCGLLLLVPLTWGLMLPHEPLHRAAILSVLSFAVIGGVGFAIGALTNLDAAITPLSFIFAASASGMLSDYARGRAPMWLVVTERLLPPARGLHDSAGIVLDGSPFVWTPFVAVLLWAAAGWALGVLLLRRRALAR